MFNSSNVFTFKMRVRKEIMRSFEAKPQRESVRRAKVVKRTLCASSSDRKSTRLNSSHLGISYAVFCLNDTSTTLIYTLSLHDALPIFMRSFEAKPQRESVRRAKVVKRTLCASS